MCEGADYRWADELRETVHCKAVDALVLLADHAARSRPDPDQALALLDQATEWDLYNEAVYQRIIRLQRATGRDDAAHRTYALIARWLADLDTTPDPATTALLRQDQPVAARRLPGRLIRPAGGRPVGPRPVPAVGECGVDPGVLLGQDAPGRWTPQVSGRFTTAGQARLHIGA